MDRKQKEELSRLCGPALRFDSPLAPYTTFRVGGAAEALYEATGVEALQEVVNFLIRESIPYLVFGLGSNLLVKDEGLEGVVILLRGMMAQIYENKETECSVTSGAGVTLSDLLVHCRKKGLGGISFLSGIPGTVGGAVAMNAGAFGEEVGRCVEQIQIISPSGDLKDMDRSQMRFSYRALALEEGSIIVRASLTLQYESSKAVARSISDYLKRRRESQPWEYPSAGSVFKNPPHDYAGRLIESVGLKGKRVGGAMISPKHANFIVNTGDASARDILSLLHLAREKVRKETGIALEPEIRIVGR